jgi:hypothetical protein
MTRRGNVEKIILDFAKAVCEGERTMIDEKKVELMKKLQRLAERLLGFCTIRKHNSNNVRRLRQRR